MRSRAVVRQNDFSFGELSPDHASGGDKDAVARSLKRGRNIRLLNSFAFKQRFGSKRLAKIDDEGRPTTLVLKDGTEYIGYLRPGGMDVYTTTGAVVQSIEGAPWSDLATIKEATVHTRVGKLYVAHNDFVTQVFSYDDALGTWSLAPYAFASGAGGALLQLYYRFAAPGITMQPSALTGAINLVFSADALVPAHAGTMVRYNVVDAAGPAILINTVVDARHATATVLNDLPPTIQVQVENSAGFIIGEEVKGLDTTATGFVTAISGAYITIAMTRGYQGFDDRLVDKDGNGTLDSGEYLVGEFTRSYIVKNSLTTVAPAAVVAWDEAVVSPVHGYPGDVFERSGRLGFADFPDLGDGIALSAPDAPTNFEITGGGPSAAIFEVLGQESGQRIKFAVSAANLLILTTKAAYYVPEGTDVPLSADTWSVVKIGPAGTSNAFPAIVDEGVVYVERGGNRVIALLSTGSLTAPWQLVDVSRQAGHLISNPTSIAVTNGSTQAAERYIMALNDNGTVAVLFFDQNPARLGWTLWSTDGDYTAMTTIDGFLYTSCNRTIAGEEVTFLERFDADAQLDCSVAFGEAGASSSIVTGGGEGLVSGGGEQIVTAVGIALEDLAGETVAVNIDTAYLGTFVVADDGTIPDLDSALFATISTGGGDAWAAGSGDVIVSGASGGNFEAGFHFDMDAVLWPPEPEGDQRPSFAKRHIGRVDVRVQDTQSFAFGIEDQSPVTIPVFLPLDDTAAEPPLRSQNFRRAFMGWLDEPSVQITRPIPQPVHVLSVAQEVAF